MATLAQLLILGIRPTGVVPPTLGAISLSSTAFLDTVSAGAVIGTLSGKTAGSTLAISPNDGVLVISTDQTQVLRGLSAVTDGSHFYSVVETRAGAIGSPRTNTFDFVVSAPGIATSLTPSAAWDKTAGSGLTAAGVNFDPTVPTRTTGSVKPVLKILSMDRSAITGDLDVYYQARMAKHLGGYDCYVAWESAEVLDSNAPAVYTRTDINGNTKTMRCRKVTLKGAAAQALHGDGAAVLAIRAVPRLSTSNGLTLLPRTEIATYFPRLALNRQTASAGPQTAGSEYDLILDVDPNQGAPASVTGTTVTFLYNPGTLSNGMAVAGAGITATTISGVTKQWDGTSAICTVAASQSTIARVAILLNAGTDVAGHTYYDDTTKGGLQKAWDYINANSSYLLVGVRFIRSGNGRQDKGSSANTVSARAAWIKHFNKTGVDFRIGDKVNFAGAGFNGYMGIDAPMFEGLNIDLRQINVNLNSFVQNDGNRLIGFNGSEIYHGSDTFTSPYASGAGMQSLWGGDGSSTTWLAAGSLIDSHFYDNFMHDISGRFVSGSKGRIVGNVMQDASGSAFVNSPAAFHGNKMKRNGGVWSGLRTFLPVLQLTGPSGSRFGVLGKSGNPRQVTIFEGADNAWTPNTGHVIGTSAAMPIPASGGSAQGKILWVGWTDTNFDLYLAVGNSAVTATYGTGTATPVVGTPDTTVRVLAGSGGSFITLAGTETHIAMIVFTGQSLTGATVVRSVKDSAICTFDNAIPANTITVASVMSDLASYHSTDSRYNATAITPAHPTDPVMAAVFLTGNTSPDATPNSGRAVQTPPTAINGSTFANGGAPGTLYTWADQHGECFFWDSGIYENVLVEYNDLSQIRVANIMQINGFNSGTFAKGGATPSTMNDFYRGYNTCCTDDVLVYGEGVSGGGVGGIGSHVVMERESWAGGSLGTSSAAGEWVPDAACSMTEMAMYNFGGTDAFAAVMTDIRFGMGQGVSLPPGADATTCNVTALDDTHRFTFIPTSTANENTDPDWTPKAELLLTDGVNYAGGFNGDGSRKIAA